MVNSQSLIKIASFFAIAVVIYALRPMPEYALHARTAAGMYEASDINEQEALEGLQRLTASVEAEMIGAQAMLDLPYVPDEAIEQLNHHLMELNKLSQSMHSQLIARFGEERGQKHGHAPAQARGQGGIGLDGVQPQFDARPHPCDQRPLQPHRQRDEVRQGGPAHCHSQRTNP